ncbi:MAG TPA: hypothetical protein VJZ72_10310 [Candidatus Limnocylindrales bacterium]|nr:hypothetical protein [Candidatus Limnocylindrales bacterium]
MKTFLIGLLSGAVGATSVVILGTLSVFIGVPLLIVGVLIPPRFFGAAGTLIGFGAGWIVLFGRVAITCRLPYCQGPDGSSAIDSLAPWVAVGAIGVIAGLVLLGIGLARRPR